MSYGCGGCGVLGFRYPLTGSVPVNRPVYLPVNEYQTDLAAVSSSAGLPTGPVETRQTSLQPPNRGVLPAANKGTGRCAHQAAR
jgi:hypothetical protein